MQEGEAGVLLGDMLLGNDAAASGGQYVAMDAGAAPLYSGPNPSHRARYCVTITTPGDYFLIADIYAILRIAQSSGGNGEKAIWIAVVLVLPVLGLIIWYLMGPGRPS